MLNRNVMGRTPDDEVYGRDLTSPPEADLPVDPQDNSTAMLGSPSEGTGEISPEEAGPAAGLAFLGMMIQGGQGLSTLIPGFVPMEITAWLQQAMQVLPQIIQQMQSSASMMGSGMPGGGMQGAPMMSQLGPMSGAPSQSAGPSGPPKRPY